MSSIKFKNKIRGKSLDHVISLCDAVVLAKLASVETQEIDLGTEGVPHFPVEISTLTVSKIIHQKQLDEPIAANSTITVFPGALPKQIEQFKVYHEKRLKKSMIFESYTCSDSTEGERYYFLQLTCFGWCFVCKNASEGKASRDEVTLQCRASFPSM